ncbi:heavy metal translocating P-type ATPase [Agromyces larvae]|uniref:Heavy metal translocating P-type ATPase n=1 Tax=Agromyces larvae TaxID=2929802 RepID=A0ABY4BWE6_9MICO|nr:heavy metal translocating P-type ATPase [Agromyces larvae]UOE43474.1 heavy metal translocating P-type ATPase [Agromyces larvae]
MTDTASRPVELVVGGMTCASCAARIEKRLNRMPGVEASVNFATEKATVRLPDGTAPADAIAVIEATGYTAELPAPPEPAPGAEPTAERSRRRAHGASLDLRLRVSLALAIPVAALSMIPPLQFAGWQWVALVLATPVATWGAWPFHRAAWLNLRHGSATMDTLISLGVIAAYGWSVVALVFGGAGMPGMTMEFRLLAEPGSVGDELYLEVAAAVTVFMLAGRVFESRAKRRSTEAISALLELGAREASVLRDGVEVRVPVGALVVGDRFVVRPGEQVATDGRVVEGASAIDASLVTGESAPVEVGVGDEVVGATLNAGGRLVVEATRVGADTELATMARLVEEAQSGKAEVQRLADRVSAVFVPVVLALAAVALIGWLVAGAGAAVAFSAAVATLVIACPCALGLATPMALLVGTGRGARLGILIRGAHVLESTRRIDTVVLDKTGTVTSGRMSLTDVVPVAGLSRDEVLRFAAAAEAGSEHPIGRAIAAGDAALGHRDPAHLTGSRDGSDSVGRSSTGETTDFSSEPGGGVQAVVDGRLVLVGRPGWLADAWAIGLPDGLALARDELESRGRTVVAVAWDGALRGILAVADEPKPTSASAVAALRDLGLEPVLLTGDRDAVARTVAAEVGITDVRADVRPAGKAEAVRALQADGRVVAMVGDGVNDAAALATADLGIAMGGGTDAAIAASDLTLVRDDLAAVGDALRLSRRTLATIKQNLFWAFAYNAAAIPVAMLGMLSPLLAGAAMAASSAFVVANSLRLARFR